LSRKSRISEKAACVRGQTSRRRAIATGSGPALQAANEVRMTDLRTSPRCRSATMSGVSIPLTNKRILADRRGVDSPAKAVSGLGPCALGTNRLQLHRTIRDRNPERRPDRTFDQMDVAAVRAYQFRCDRKAKAAAART